MTRKDYVLIAGAIRGAREDIERMFSENGHGDEKSKRIIGVRWAEERIAEALAIENPRFNKEKFIKACDIEAV